MRNLFDGAAWMRYTQSFVPRTFKEFWTCTIGLVMIMFMWSFVNTVAKEQWKIAASQQKHNRND
jgi:hypothetical protein